jgi:hypothetical protein
MKKKVLIVGMVDSIHLARWLSQFKDKDFDFLVFPSKTFKEIHPRLLELINQNNNLNLVFKSTPKSFTGYIDFFFFRVLQNLLGLDLRSRYLSRVIGQFSPDYVHAIEIQGAGYLCERAIDFKTKSFKLILTNWGSDIFYFQNLPDHKSRIISILEKSDFYSAECARDYSLALNLGFKGVALPCIPNAGGFSTSELEATYPLPSLRTNIVVKAYGGLFGRGDLVIEALQEILLDFQKFTVYLYSVTADLLPQVLRLSNSYPDRIRYSMQGKGIPHNELQLIFSQSRVYVGCSISDGISTSFLESLVVGSFPIQTNTSCANEWVKRGAIATLIPLELTSLKLALRSSLDNDSTVDEAFRVNSAVAKRFLNGNRISELASSFYNNA